MYLAVKEVHRIVSDRRLYVHCIGHSLGAHACGFLGKHLIADPAGMDGASHLLFLSLSATFEKWQLTISTSRAAGIDGLLQK